MSKLEQETLNMDKLMPPLFCLDYEGIAQIQEPEKQNIA